MKQEGITRRRFIKGLPIVAAVAAGALVSGREEVAAYVSDAPALSEEFESSLTCLARVERVERYDHTNYTNGVPWKAWEIQADCTAYDAYGKEFPLHLYYCFFAEREGDESETARLLAVLRAGAVVVVSGCMAFFDDGAPTTIFGARLRRRTA